LARANALLAESLELAQAGHNQSEIAATLILIGHVARAEGDDRRAATCYEESLALAYRIGARLLVAQIRHNQAYIALHQDDVVGATANLLESLTISCELNSAAQMAWGIAALGCTAVTAGYPEQAAWLFGAAEAHFSAINQCIGRTEQDEHVRHIT